ncbi:MAG: nucleoside deaminase [Paenibacillus dendritiformis]|uniref:nucleoside deaminase n=1 Tax=Paenibacillus dendritiformis TaxID=130049 RepID=UPI00143D6C56|nr:nucleoside deaminase [Paenibacillus dendritiformis]MDU5145908.1 nucleoside deaminase [Paenibacillus dendritiformis]NKI23515.1 nucleoside deaminase [Paenibacillus dendritiformis]NRG00480.1 nucleoside deaminase [Paenibacillus dendritiformis]GIO75752.1 tRNA-specific adenosine deaminase [Paenibacillus dendritiformis]
MIGPDSQERQAMNHQAFMDQAVRLAYEHTVRRGGKPFGAVLVREGQVIATAVNEVLTSHDPTDHAEMRAIRDACRKLGTPDLSECVLYASGQPCPMCLSAAYLAKLPVIYHAYGQAEAEGAGLGTSWLYKQIALPAEARQLRMVAQRPDAGADSPYAAWMRRQAGGNGGH